MRTGSLCKLHVAHIRAHVHAHVYPRTRDLSVTGARVQWGARPYAYIPHMHVASTGRTAPRHATALFSAGGGGGGEELVKSWVAPASQNGVCMSMHAHVCTGASEYVRARAPAHSFRGNAGKDAGVSLLRMHEQCQRHHCYSQCRIH